VTLQPVTSSFIKAIGYEPEKKTLRVQFSTGETWDYYAVEPELFEQFQAAESAGKFFHSRVKGLRAKLVGRAVGSAITARLGPESVIVQSVERPDGTIGPPLTHIDERGRAWMLVGYMDKVAHYEPKT
jgi:KTSC domain-containing protein